MFVEIEKKGIQWDNDFNGWVNMSHASMFVMVLNADKVFDEIAKRWSEVTKGTLFNFVVYLIHHMDAFT